jgi:hypothetical protein
MRDALTLLTSRTGYSWPVLLFTWAGLWLACYAVSRACEAPVRRWDDDDN